MIPAIRFEAEKKKASFYAKNGATRSIVKFERGGFLAGRFCSFQIRSEVWRGATSG